MRHAIYKVQRGLAAVFVTGLLVTAQQAMGAEVTLRTAQGAYEDVRQDLVDAVVNRGYKIDYEAFIGDMLKRTSSDVDGKKQIYKNASSVQFCSAVLSRAAMEADPANIASCPYILFIYEKADQPGAIHVGFRRLDETGSDASKMALAKVNSVLEEIVDEAAGE